MTKGIQSAKLENGLMYRFNECRSTLNDMLCSLQKFPVPFLLFVVANFALYMILSPSPCALSAVLHRHRDLISFFLTDLHSDRIPPLVNYIESSARTPGFGYYLVNWTLDNLTWPPSLAPPTWYSLFVRTAMTEGGYRDDPKSAELIAKFFFAVEYFLVATSAEWFWRGTDDVVINFPLLQPLINALNTRYDPLRELVFLGNCIHGGRDRPAFLQGGSGYLLSRSACEQLAPYAQHFALYARGQEDQYFGDFLRTHFGVTGQPMTSYNYLGYAMSEDEGEALLRQDYQMFMKCPEVRKLAQPTDICRRDVAPLQRIVFFHQSMTNFSQHEIRLAQAVFDAPLTIRYYMFMHVPRICKTEL
jgi:hypothetical protein